MTAELITKIVWKCDRCRREVPQNVIRVARTGSLDPHFKVIIEKVNGEKADLCESCFEYLIRVASNIKSEVEALPDPTDDEHG